MVWVNCYGVFAAAALANYTELKTVTMSLG